MQFIIAIENPNQRVQFYKKLNLLGVKQKVWGQYYEIDFFLFKPRISLF